MENSPSFTSPTSTTSAANNSSNTTGTSAVTAGTNSSIGPNTTVLARALFDNSAEVAQELTFSRGDVLIVLKRDPPGFEGWWICSLAGRVGIAPGNRLEILGSVKKDSLEEKLVQHCEK
ncbi:Cas scaffolding protein family member 4 [Echinococcus granulosus]|uniref:Cas scaffolding protein family member 4 n=1 Tax=Echinococcus granulosus TaxID=6210 RepID=W6U6S8_ECHGR|nr:Cas scaffolding protein family member 4 [Echinococcus granulosus]EUB56056.1 Cas scaffolding protein family member 4 [Echinococcus granulosus]